MPHGASHWYDPETKRFAVNDRKSYTGVHAARIVVAAKERGAVMAVRL